jgi:hypothetical protein
MKNCVKTISSIVHNTVNSFKCSVHPVLQFGTVAQKKVDEIEKNYKINQHLNLGRFYN